MKSDSFNLGAGSEADDRNLLYRMPKIQGIKGGADGEPKIYVYDRRNQQSDRRANASRRDCL